MCFFLSMMNDLGRLPAFHLLRISSPKPPGTPVPVVTRPLSIDNQFYFLGGIAYSMLWQETITSLLFRL